MPKNPFKTDIRRKLYDAMLTAYRERTTSLFARDGSPRFGTGSMAGYFWRGYDGKLKWDTGSKRMLGYACYRAGEDARKYEPLP